MTNPVALSPAEVRAALDATLERMEDPRLLGGQHIPSSARIWAEEHRLPVRETRFAPAGGLYIVGAVRVEGVLVP